MYRSKKGQNGINVKDLTLNINGNTVTVSKGSLKNIVHVNSNTVVTIENNVCDIYNTKSKMYAGTDYSNIYNAVKGLYEAYTEEVQIRGSGYKLAMQPTEIKFSLGYSHPIVVQIPTGISITQDTGRKSGSKENVLILVIKSHDKHLVSQFASELTRLRTVNPYKLTGVTRVGTFVRAKKSTKGK